jgi:hypothetical protein
MDWYARVKHELCRNAMWCMLYTCADGSTFSASAGGMVQTKGWGGLDLGCTFGRVYEHETCRTPEMGRPAREGTALPKLMRAAIGARCLMKDQTIPRFFCHDQPK